MMQLLDTNVVIDYTAGRLPVAGKALVEQANVGISVITRIELYGWKGITDRVAQQLDEFVDISTQFGVTELVILAAITIRQGHKIKTPDAIIAATALVHGLQLVTRNEGDFRGIDGLQVVNPWAV